MRCIQQIDLFFGQVGVFVGQMAKNLKSANKHGISGGVTLMALTLSILSQTTLLFLVKAICNLGQKNSNGDYRVNTKFPEGKFP